MPIGPARMPLLDHLGELRRRLTIVIVTIVVATVVMYFATPVLVDILKELHCPVCPGWQVLHHHLARRLCPEILYRHQDRCGHVHADDHLADFGLFPAGAQAQ